MFHPAEHCSTPWDELTNYPPTHRLDNMDAPALSPISLRLKEFREGKGLSQAELARRSDVSQSTISRIEAGATGGVSLANLERLADALGINAALLIVHQAKVGKRGGG
jgi:DNA-binding XRE family transcriptional regulator